MYQFGVLIVNNDQEYFSVNLVFNKAKFLRISRTFFSNVVPNAFFANVLYNNGKILFSQQFESLID
jgi:hypothetical protein